ncbi:DSBA oxidoreductase [Microtetraspora sp. NBRC 13810]|uniref:DsbA family oxidoreductase n=1 Tax=Microtetraspora sp. NBRC 13810 TaxID=3030990 RepID=UPI0024A26170|nr:DsbA family oxidoreductase [Microtetraspora sp. NBRC 13810]GLW07167.1 DSBA oxidoreductase [Microtetraspora sp. NBRC 13810]
MRIEVWSDVVCPWCYIGKRRLERALSGFEHAGEVEVVWRSFQLDPSTPRGARVPVRETIAQKMGGSMKQVMAMTEHVSSLAAQEGLAYDFDRSVSANTFDAHRLTHLAAAHGLGGEMHERLLSAQLIEGETLDDAETLVRLGAEVGVPAGDARRMLAGDEYAEDVRDDVREAQALGVSGVPFFVLDRAYGVSGAQPVETFASALRTAYEHAGAATGRS